MYKRDDSQRMSSRRLIVGFGTTLALLLVVAAYGLIRLWQIDVEVNSIVEVHNVKNKMLNEMRDSVRQRQYRLREMVVFTDEFEREDTWLAYTLAADRFMTARNSYRAFPRSGDEDEAHKVLNNMANSGVMLEREMVDLLRAGGDIREVSHQAFDYQASTLRSLEQLIDINRMNEERALSQAQQDTRVSIYTMSVLMCLGLLTGVGVSYRVISRDKIMVNSLHRQRDEMEEMKDVVSDELATYSYALAHDLVAPLRAVTGFSQILIEEAAPRLQEEELANLNRVANAGKKMNQIIEDMLRLSRVTRADVSFETVNLSTIAEQIRVSYSERFPDVRVDWVLADNLSVYGDCAMLNELMKQLFDNAFRFSRERKKPQITFDKKTINGRQVFCVADNGVGIDAKYVNRVFTPFEKLTTLVGDSGSGVGLALADRIMRRHLGRIWIDSAADKGVTVFFTFPEREE